MNRKVTRRRMLQGAGVLLALPALECLQRRVGATENKTSPPMRMLLISNNLGVLPKPFFPKTDGSDYKLSPYLSELKDCRDDFTVFSGLSHPDVEGGHSTENCFLTGARGPTRSGFRNTISLDQYAAEALGPVTRFPTLNLGVNIDKANRSLAWTRDGVLLPAEDKASTLFRKMFVQGDKAAVAQQLNRLEERGSILDALLDDAKRFERGLGGSDKRRLDQYFTSVREIEQRLHSAREWQLKPKPTTTHEPPTDINDRKLFFDKFELMLSMARLALESDSTRIVTLMVDAFATPAFQLHKDQNTTRGYHGLSHHGQSPELLKQLDDADRQQMRLVRDTIQHFAKLKDTDRRQLDRTMILYGSNMGDSNIHTNTNLPILLAGGGFKHGRHLKFNAENNTPLCNLFVTMLESMGIDAESFASSTGSIGELNA